jgi:hypothetical protein
VRTLLRDRFRTLGLAQAPSSTLKTVLLFAALAVIVLLAAVYGRTPDLSYVKVAFLSGSRRSAPFGMPKHPSTLQLQSCKARHTDALPLVTPLWL